MSQPAVLPIHTAVPGRARFSVPGLKRNERVRRALEAGLGGRGIRSVSASTSTGTVLVLFETEHDLVEITRRLGESAERALDPNAPDGSSARPSWHAMDADHVIGAVNSRPSGLSEGEAKARLAETGANAIAPISGRTQLEILLSQFHSLPIALLAAGAVLSIATGGLLDAAIILAVIGLNGAIGFIAEARAEETIGSLSESRAPVSRVLRGGKECEVPAEELVPGDLIELRRDELVPADARVITANRLTVNEAMLTGESVPVVKASNALAPHHAPIADRHNMVFRGTVVTGGAGRAVVTATGPETELGRIQSLLGSEDQPATPLQRQLDALGRQLVLGSVAACGLFAVIGLIRGFGLLPLLKTVTSLAVAAVPEGLPTLATTTLALAVQDLRRHRIIIRRLSAVEGLAAVEVACFDKTGTLTLNDMSVVRLYWNQTRARLTDEQFRTETGAVAGRTTDREVVRLLELAILCNDVELLDAAAGHANGSATEMALVRAAIRAGLDVGAIRLRHPRRATLERAEDRRFMVTVHDAAADQTLVIVKGDPSEVLALCRWHLHNGVVAPLEDEDRRTIEAENLAMAEDALRVLGIAYRSAGAEDRGTRIEQQDFIWAGLVGMADPIRKGAPDLIDAFRRAGITSIMLTGDQRATAAAVAAELGLSNGKPAEIVEAGQLEEFDAKIARSDLPRVFARVAPGQKLQLVKKLQGSRVGRRDDRRWRQRYAAAARGGYRHCSRTLRGGGRARHRRRRIARRRSRLSDRCRRARPHGRNQYSQSHSLSRGDQPQRDHLHAGCRGSRPRASAEPDPAAVDQPADRCPAGTGARYGAGRPRFDDAAASGSAGTGHFGGGVRHARPRRQPDRRQRFCRPGLRGPAWRLGTIGSDRRV